MAIFDQTGGEEINCKSAKLKVLDIAASCVHTLISLINEETRLLFLDFFPPSLATREMRVSK